MVKSKVKSIKLEELESLINDENSCISLNKIQEHLVLHPYHLNDLQNSVKEILNKKIARYSPSLDGILCGYKNINFLSDVGRIFHDAFFIHIDIEVDCFVFKPTLKKSLEAVVNKVSSDHVGCLVHNLFNVSLPKPKHVEEWAGQSLSPEDKVVVEITSVNFDIKLPYIRAEIKSESNVAEITSQKVKKKSKKHKHQTEEGDEEFVEESSESPKKKAKKRKHQGEDEAQLTVMEESEESPRKKSKKKKHQDENEESESPRQRKKSRNV